MSQGTDGRGGARPSDHGGYKSPQGSAPCAPISWIRPVTHACMPLLIHPKAMEWGNRDRPNTQPLPQRALHPARKTMYERLTDSVKGALGYRRVGKTPPTRSSPTQGVEDARHEVEAHKHGHPAGGPQAPRLHGVALLFSLKHLLQERQGSGGHVLHLRGHQPTYLRGPCQHRSHVPFPNRPQGDKGTSPTQNKVPSHPGTAVHGPQNSVEGWALLRSEPTSFKCP